MPDDEEKSGSESEPLTDIPSDEENEDEASSVSDEVETVVEAQPTDQETPLGAILSHARTMGSPEAAVEQSSSGFRARTPEEREEHKRQKRREYYQRRRAREGKPVYEKGDAPAPATLGAAVHRSPQADIASLANAVVVPLIVLVISKAFGEEATPTEQEAIAFAVPLVHIIVRHVPITSKMNADAVDALAMFAAVVSWYARVKPNLKMPEPKSKTERPAKSSRDNGKTTAADGTLKFLDDAAERSVPSA